MDKAGRRNVLRFRTERDTRFTQLLLYLSFMSVFNPVTCQEVNAFIGDTVLLLCVCNEAKGGDLTIYWVDENDGVVIDFPRNNIPVPKNPRVVTFPEPYKTGNFSVLMKDVKQSDSGLYVCRLSTVDFLSRIYLNVTGERPQTTITPSGSSGVAMVTPNTFSIMLLSLSVIALLPGRT